MGQCFFCRQRRVSCRPHSGVRTPRAIAPVTLRCSLETEEISCFPCGCRGGTYTQPPCVSRTAAACSPDRRSPCDSCSSLWASGQRSTSSDKGLPRHSNSFSVRSGSGFKLAHMNFGEDGSTAEDTQLARFVRPVFRFTRDFRTPLATEQHPPRGCKRCSLEAESLFSSHHPQPPRVPAPHR